MSKARHLGNLLDTDGDVISSSLDNVDTSSFIEKINWQHNAGTVGTFNETASIGSISIGAVSGLSGSTMTATSNDLPAGLSLSAAGALTGTHPNITATTTSTFNVSVTDGTNNASREYTITNTADNDAPVWNTASGALTAGSTAAYSVQLSATEPEGGSLTYSLVSGSLPNSLSINSSGLISGTPSADGTFNFTISVTDGTTPVSRSFSIAVNLWQGMAATGGTITTDGDYKVHIFNSSGTFQITTLGSDAVVEYLVIAGGGGGGGFRGGGGGAGGYRTATDLAVTATSYAVTVGGGGANPSWSGGYGNPADNGDNGDDSIFHSITSAGGGGGGTYKNPSGIAGENGGSGGGGGAGEGSGGGSGGSASPAGQGYDGARGNREEGGGGGGSGAVGESGTNSSPWVGGAGGNGLSSSITGSAVTRGGGGGGSYDSGPGGSGGGGAGAPSSGSGTNGTVNTGGGGGGSGNSTGAGGTGGSGVVIIRYKFQ